MGTRVLSGLLPQADRAGRTCWARGISSRDGDSDSGLRRPLRQRARKAAGVPELAALDSAAGQRSGASAPHRGDLSPRTGALRGSAVRSRTETPRLGGISLKQGLWTPILSR